MNHWLPSKTRSLSLEKQQRTSQGKACLLCCYYVNQEGTWESGMLVTHFLYTELWQTDYQIPEKKIPIDNLGHDDRCWNVSDFFFVNFLKCNKMEESQRFWCIKPENHVTSTCLNQQSNLDRFFTSLQNSSWTET